MRLPLLAVGSGAVALFSISCATAVLDETGGDAGVIAWPDASQESSTYGGSDAGTSEAAADSGIACEAGTACGTSCVDTEVDLQNCGTCNTVCAGADASCIVGECSATLHVTALIDGESQLVVVGSVAHWHHISDSNPGLWNGNDAPTTIDSVAWYPTWPGGTCTNCDSSNTATVTPLAAKAQTVALVVSAGRDSLTITQQPTAANSYTLIVDFNDVASSGAAYYTANLTYETN